MLVVLLLAHPAASGHDEVGIKYSGLVARYDVQIPMRDGVRLSANVFGPKDSAKHPTMMQQTPYDKDTPNSMDDAWAFVKRGYVYVTVDVRGRYDSQGVFQPFRDGRDGSDVLDWIARQPWSNGKVATHGASYGGNTQWELAKQNNPHHAAMLSYVSPADGFGDLIRFDGVPKLDLFFTWMMGMYGRVNHPLSGFDWSQVMHSLPLDKLDGLVGRDVRYWREAMAHDRLDEFWTPMQLTGNYNRFDIPSFNVTGWYEGQLRGQVQNFVGAVKNSKRPDDDMLVIGPWLHNVNHDRKIGERDAGPQAIIDLDHIRDAWLDHVMLGTPKPDDTHLLYFLPVKNEWRGANAWPIPGTHFKTFLLASGGKANSLDGDGVLVIGDEGHGDPDSYTYDPANPVPSVSSRTSGARGSLPQGSVDNRVVEERPDVLVYTSNSLADDTEVTGPVSATIYFSTDVVDTDFTVKLLDVYPDGRALNLSEGIARAKYRKSFATPELLTAGKVYKLDVTMYPTSNYFESGHRIRIEVSSSDFPNFARNLNVANSDTGAAFKIAHTRIYHSQEYPSAIVLPVIPSGTTPRLNP